MVDIAPLNPDLLEKPAEAIESEKPAVQQAAPEKDSRELPVDLSTLSTPKAGKTKPSAAAVEAASADAPAGVEAKEAEPEVPQNLNTPAEATAEPGAMAVANEPPSRKRPVGLFYHDKPLFGLDIGAHSLKVMQLRRHHGEFVVTGYGLSEFDTSAIKDSEIINPQSITDTIKKLLDKDMRGKITTKRVAITIPSAKCFVRSISIPAAAADDLHSAVLFDIEQYIPMPISELYLDYHIISRSESSIELLVVAVPRKIVDSYLVLADMLDLEVVSVEPTITANTRLFSTLEKVDAPTILIDCGSITSDVIVYDKALLTASTVAGGGDTFTATMAKKMHVQSHEARFLKTKYGLTKSLTQKDAQAALAPVLTQIVQEMKRIVRYYEEHVNGDRKIDQIVVMGEGADMPGFSEYLTDALRIPARTFLPWLKMDFEKVDKKHRSQKHPYATVAGLALIEPKELFR